MLTLKLLREELKQSIDEPRCPSLQSSYIGEPSLSRIGLYNYHRVLTRQFSKLLGCAWQLTISINFAIQYTVGRSTREFNSADFPICEISSCTARSNMRFPISSCTKFCLGLFFYGNYIPWLGVWRKRVMYCTKLVNLGERPSIDVFHLYVENKLGKAVFRVILPCKLELEFRPV